jgi:hypothetical protein
VKDNLTHWYRDGEKVNQFQKVWTGCHKMLHATRDIDLLSPTCEACQVAKAADIRMRRNLLEAMKSYS